MLHSVLYTISRWWAGGGRGGGGGSEICGALSQCHARGRSTDVLACKQAGGGGSGAPPSQEIFSFKFFSDYFYHMRSKIKSPTISFDDIYSYT